MSWVTIHRGPGWEVDLLRGALEENDIPAFSPDVNLKTLDPFITGPLSFDRRLQVPEELAAQATAVLAELHEKASLEPGPRSTTVPAATGEPEGALLRLEGIGRRICWASLLPITAPFALFGAWRYFADLRSVAARPRNHALVIGALVLSVPQCVVLIACGSSLWADVAR